MAVAHQLDVMLKAKLFRGLADPSRLTIVEALRDGEKTVSQIVEATGLSQPNASTHLACLQDCGLVTRRQAGRFVYYTLADARMEAVLHTVEDMVQGISERIDRCPRYER
ncbi:MAG TPA: metalloregulator ArsR/SmtB family transcription factor [Herpetosiphonaceae bacterium]